MDARSFGNFIARCRKRCGMTQADLAGKLNVTDKAVSRWERGIGFPDISTIEPLADALELSVQQLMKSDATNETTKNKKRDFYIHGSQFWPHRVWLSDQALADLPDGLHEHVQGNGKVYVVRELDGDKVAVCVSKDGNGLTAAVDRSEVRSRLHEATASVVSTYPEEMQRHIKNGGRLYLMGHPKDGDDRITVSTSPGSDGYTIEVEYRPWSYDMETDITEIGWNMARCIYIIRRARSDAKKKYAANDLRNYLIYCTTVKELDELTSIYRDKACDNAIGYNPSAVANFVGALRTKYPKEPDIGDKAMEHRDFIYGEIGSIMADCIGIIRSGPGNEEYERSVTILRTYIDDCLSRAGMEDMALIFKDKSCDNDIGYDLDALDMFARALIDEYGYVHK